MATEMVRMSVSLPDWLWDAIEDYRHAHRLSTKAAAINALLEAGLKTEKAPTNKPEARKLDEAKIRKHVKALQYLLDQESG